MVQRGAGKVVQRSYRGEGMGTMGRQVDCELLCMCNCFYVQSCLHSICRHACAGPLPPGGGYRRPRPRGGDQTPEVRN